MLGQLTTEAGTKLIEAGGWAYRLVIAAIQMAEGMLKGTFEDRSKFCAADHTKSPLSGPLQRALSGHERQISNVRGLSAYPPRLSVNADIPVRRPRARSGSEQVQYYRCSPSLTRSLRRRGPASSVEFRG